MKLKDWIFEYSVSQLLTATKSGRFEVKNNRHTFAEGRLLYVLTLSKEY